MPPARPVRVLLLTTLLAAATAGCGPTRTPGTAGVPRDRLALLHVPGHNDVRGWRNEAVHVAGVKIDGTEYPERGDVDFLLAPGTHDVEVFYDACVHGPAAWFNPWAGLALLPPHGDVRFVVTPGGRYVLTGVTHGGGSIMRHAHDVRDARTGASAAILPPAPVITAALTRPATGPPATGPAAGG